MLPDILSVARRCARMELSHTRLTEIGLILQEVEYVKQEAKLVYLLECLQKTAPPVLIFAEKQTDVDDVHEYLMSKDVDAVAVHGQKTQEERAEAIDQFKVCCTLCWHCKAMAT